MTHVQYGQSQSEKSKYFSTSTTTASKYITKRPRPHFIKFSKTVSQCSLSKFGSERGDSIDADSGRLGYVL